MEQQPSRCPRCLGEVVAERRRAPEDADNVARRSARDAAGAAEASARAPHRRDVVEESRDWAVRVPLQELGSTAQETADLRGAAAHEPLEHRCSLFRRDRARRPGRRRFVHVAFGGRTDLGYRAPQLMLSAGSRDRDDGCQASMDAFAAAWLPCPGEPSTKPPRNTSRRSRADRRASAHATPTRRRPWRRKDGEPRPIRCRSAPSSSAPAEWTIPQAASILCARS